LRITETARFLCSWPSLSNREASCVSAYRAAHLITSKAPIRPSPNAPENTLAAARIGSMPQPARIAAAGPNAPGQTNGSSVPRHADMALSSYSSGRLRMTWTAVLVRAPAAAALRSPGASRPRRGGVLPHDLERLVVPCHLEMGEHGVGQARRAALEHARGVGPPSTRSPILACMWILYAKSSDSPRAPLAGPRSAEPRAAAALSYLPVCALASAPRTAHPWQCALAHARAAPTAFSAACYMPSSEAVRAARPSSECASLVRTVIII